MSVILRDTMDLMHIMGQLFMAQDIGITHGMLIIIIQDQLLMALGFIIIHGQDGDIVLASAMAGSLSGGILTIGAGGAPVDTGMDIDMATGMDIVMDTDMDIVMAIMQEEERDTGQAIMQDPGILLKAMCIKIGQMEFGIQEQGLQRDRAMLVQDHQILIRDRQIPQQETGRQPSPLNQKPGKTMCILIKAVMFTKETIAAIGSKETMDSGTILLIPAQAREAARAI